MKLYCQINKSVCFVDQTWNLPTYPQLCCMDQIMSLTIYERIFKSSVCSVMKILANGL